MVIDIKSQLFELQDTTYQAFQQKLVPNIDKNSIIGVRVPMLRNFAKQMIMCDIADDFLAKLPHDYYEENIIHSILISNIKNIDDCLQKIEQFAPYIDNWAVCDTISPKIFNKHPEKLLKKIKSWIKSKHNYTKRVAIVLLMEFFLKENFDKSHLIMVSSIISEDYYVNMARAWYFSEALVHRYDDTVKIIEQQSMDKFTQNKSIQKANESFRLTIDTKRYLKSLKIK